MATPVPLVDPQGEVRLSTLSHVVAIADGEGLDVVAWSFGIKLYRLDESYHARWSAEIMPPHIGQAYSPAHEPLARDSRGNIYVGYQIFEDGLRR